MEDYFFSDKRGRISAIEIKENGHEFLGVVLEENFHLSFPFVFEDSGNLYMIPETAENQQIRLYECISFPEKWVLKTIWHLRSKKEKYSTETKLTYFHLVLFYSQSYTEFPLLSMQSKPTNITNSYAMETKKPIGPKSTVKICHQNSKALWN